MSSTTQDRKHPEIYFWVILLVALLAAILHPITVKAPSSAKPVSPSGEEFPAKLEVVPEIYSAADLKGISPADFLKVLGNREYPEYTFWADFGHWITKKDVPTLLALVDSKQPCASVAMSASSYSSTCPSTIGDQALYMLLGYREGKYPPRLNLIVFGESRERDELINWARSVQ